MNNLSDFPGGEDINSFFEFLRRFMSGGNQNALPGSGSNYPKIPTHAVSKFLNNFNSMVSKAPGLGFSWGKMANPGTGLIPKSPGLGYHWGKPNNPGFALVPSKQMWSGIGGNNTPPPFWTPPPPPKTPKTKKGGNGGLGWFAINMEQRFFTILSRLIDDLDNLQKKALKNGLELQNAFADQTSVLKRLPGGLRANLFEAFEYFEAGIKKPGENLLKLSAHLRSVGGDTERLRTTMVGLETVARVNIDGLAKTVLNSTKTYQITSDTIIKALNSLEDRMFEFRTLGVGDQLSEAVAMMSQLGPQYSSYITTLIKKISETGVEGAANAARLGLLNERSAFMNAKTASDVVGVLKTSVSKISNLTKQYTVGTDKLIGLGAAYGLYGEDVIKAASILSDKMDSLKVVQSDQLEVYKNFGETLSNFGTQMFDPFVMAFKQVVPALTKLFSFDEVKTFGQVVAAATTMAVVGRILIKLMSLFKIAAAGASGIFGLLVGAGVLLYRLTESSEARLDLEKKKDAREEMRDSYAMRIADKNARISEEIKSLVEDARRQEAIDQLNTVLREISKKLDKNNMYTREGVEKLPNTPVRGR